MNEQLLSSHVTLQSLKTFSCIWSFVVLTFALNGDFKYKQVDPIRMHDPQLYKPTDGRDAARPVIRTTQRWPGRIYTPKDGAFTFLGSLPSQEAKGLM